MEVNESELIERYSPMDTDELLELKCKGYLAEVAEGILNDELIKRGIDIDKVKIKKRLQESIKPVVNPNKRRNLFSRLWRGEISLVVTFWVFYWIVGFVVTIGSMIIGEAFNLMYLSTYVPSFYTVFMIISLWRSANNYTGRMIWRNATQVLVILAGLSIIIVLADGVFL